jgi:hypothetical protein
MTSLSGVSAELLAPKTFDEGVRFPTPSHEVYIKYYDGKGTCGKLACLEAAPFPIVIAKPSLFSSKARFVTLKFAPGQELGTARWIR